MDIATTVIEMRTTVASMNDALTPFSRREEYEKYLSALKHYKKILDIFTSRVNDEVNKAIEKTNIILDG
jgi:uncharacterized protein (DUF885 family)